MQASLSIWDLLVLVLAAKKRTTDEIQQKALSAVLDLTTRLALFVQLRPLGHLDVVFPWAAAPPTITIDPGSDTETDSDSDSDKPEDEPSPEKIDKPEDKPSLEKKTVEPAETYVLIQRKGLDLEEKQEYMEILDLALTEADIDATFVDEWDDDGATWRQEVEEKSKELLYTFVVDSEVEEAEISDWELAKEHPLVALRKLKKTQTACPTIKRFKLTNGSILSTEKTGLLRQLWFHDRVDATLFYTLDGTLFKEKDTHVLYDFLRSPGQE
jgi:hypothetical protein